MAEHQRTPLGSPLDALFRVAGTYCHPESDERAYADLKVLARREGYEPMTRFKEDLRRALTCPQEVPKAELYRQVQYGDGSAERFLQRLWRDLYPDDPMPASADTA